ncbi:MAG TPA: class I SAM-dependent methyltransferase [Candidatus Polarisedimenticolaceae bacterium]|nr:class I SAM-dependent methyltransferase [Candidatus Polarisedimenticolaceae bacterium]
MPDSALSASEYWNRRLDPLDWKRQRRGSSRRAWRIAHATFLSPETHEAIGALGELDGLRVLELGCGQGYGSLHLARCGAHVVGIDLSERRCAAAARETRAIGTVAPAFCAADAQALPFADEAFDRIFCRDVLMYADPRRIAAECHRVLAPGGRVAFVESLEGHLALRVFRRLTSPRSYRGFTRHLRWPELGRLGPPLERVSMKPYYLFSLSAFLGLFLLRSATLYRVALRALEPLDRRLLAALPRLARWAWRGVAVYDKPRHA